MNLVILIVWLNEWELFTEDKMKLTAEQIQFNWEKLIASIETHITGDRKQAMLDFYNKRKIVTGKQFPFVQPYY